MTCYRLLGRIDLRPALSAAEHEYLLAFAESRRWRRPDGPYAVPGNPAAECLSGQPDPERWSTPAEGQPGLYCPWRPADDGGALVPHAGDDAVIRMTPREVADWLGYLYAHFLGPHPAARASPYFTDCLEPSDVESLDDPGSGGAGSDDIGSLVTRRPDRVERLQGVAVVARECGELSVVHAHGERITLRPLTAEPD